MASITNLLRSIPLILICICSVFPFTTQAVEAQNKAAKNDSNPPLVLGIFPRRDATTTIKFFTPIARYLSKQLDREVKLKTARDFPTFWDQVINESYDIVHFNQYHYIKSNTLKNYQVILQNEEFGNQTLSGAIMVRNDSGLNSLQDLKNKKIIFGGGRKAMISYVVPTALLRRAGLKKGDYSEGFSKNLPNAMLSVYYKQTDAVGIGEIVTKLPSIKSSIDISKIKILSISKPLSHLPWAVKANMSANLRSQIQHSLLALNDNPEGLAILKKANLTGIHKATDRDYYPHRKILKEVFGNKY